MPRYEDKHYTYIVTYDSYFKGTIVDLVVIGNQSAQRITPNLQHYYMLGILVGREGEKES